MATWAGGLWGIFSFGLRERADAAWLQRRPRSITTTQHRISPASSLLTTAPRSGPEPAAAQRWGRPPPGPRGRNQRVRGMLVIDDRLSTPTPARPMALIASDLVNEKCSTSSPVHGRPVKTWPGTGGPRTAALSVDSQVTTVRAARPPRPLQVEAARWVCDSAARSPADAPDRGSQQR